METWKASRARPGARATMMGPWTQEAMADLLWPSSSRPRTYSPPPPPPIFIFFIGEVHNVWGALWRSGLWRALGRSGHWSGPARSGHWRALWKRGQRRHLGVLGQGGHLEYYLRPIQRKDF